MKEFHIWNFIYTHLSKNNSVILVTVVHHENGSPGKEGFKMAVSSNGDMVGSIGGGVMELNIKNNAIELLKKNIRVKKLEKLFHKRHTVEKKSGLICAGSQTNFSISFTKDDLEKVKEIIKFIKENKTGKLRFTKDDIIVILNEKNEIPFKFEFQDKDNWYYEETLGYKYKVYVIGGGHVGLAVCKVMSLLDFHITVYDDRPNLPTMKENVYAHEKLTESYENLGNIIDEGLQTFVVIVTTAYVSDKAALVQVINKNIRYIGLMGTMTKIKKIFNEAVKDGVNKKMLKKVHAPIGIDINSDTPEEIAISITAEIIKIKNTVASD